MATIRKEISQGLCLLEHPHAASVGNQGACSGEVGAGVQDVKITKSPSEAGGNRHLQLLIDAVVDYAIYMIGLEGRVLSWNSGAARLKGYSPDEIIGQPFSRFYTAEDQRAGLPQ